MIVTTFPETLCSGRVHKGHLRPTLCICEKKDHDLRINKIECRTIRLTLPEGTVLSAWWSKSGRISTPSPGVPLNHDLGGALGLPSGTPPLGDPTIRAAESPMIRVVRRWIGGGSEISSGRRWCVRHARQVMMDH